MEAHTSVAVGEASLLNDSMFSNLVLHFIIVLFKV